MTTSPSPSPLLSLSRGTAWTGPPGAAPAEVPMVAGSATPPPAIVLEGPPDSGKSLLWRILLQALAPELVPSGEDILWARLLPSTPAAPRVRRSARGVIPAEDPPPAPEPAHFEVKWCGRDVLLRAERVPADADRIRVRLARPSSPGVLKPGCVLRGSRDWREADELHGLPLLGGSEALGAPHFRTVMEELVLWAAATWLAELGLPPLRLILTRAPPDQGGFFRLQGWGGVPLGGSRTAALSLILPVLSHLAAKGIRTSRSLTGFVFLENPACGLPPAVWGRILPGWARTFGRGLIPVVTTPDGGPLTEGVPGAVRLILRNPT